MSKAHVLRGVVLERILQLQNDDQLDWEYEDSKFVCRFTAHDGNVSLVMDTAGPSHNSSIEMVMHSVGIEGLTLTGTRVDELYDSLKNQMSNSATAPYLALFDQAFGKESKGYSR